jgi:hypothetical protein
MNGSSFDDLAKKLSAAPTRRQTLRLIAGTLAAGALSALLPGRARAAGNSACASFCNSVFGAETKAAGQCISDAAHHKGLCYTCGPASAGGTQPICCPTNNSGFCASYAGATCCSSGQICQNGACVAGTCTNTGTGTCGTLGCNGISDCFCDTKVEGGTSCDSAFNVCAPCSTDADCTNLGLGSVCITCNLCPGRTSCTIPCGSAAPAQGTTNSRH